MRNHYLITRLSDKKAFWTLRKKLLEIQFQFSKRVFGAKYFGSSKAEEMSALNYLFRKTLFPILVAVLFVAVLFLVNDYAVTFAKFIDQHVINLDWFYSEIDGDAYVQLLNTIAAISGVFLALYFTAVSTVAASVYSTVPHDIRELMLKDRLGNAYVKVIAFLTTVTVILMLAVTNGLQAPVLAPLVIVILSLFSIFSFILLGLRAFYFADPTSLADVAIRDFMKWATRASAKGWRWRDANFQEHYRRQGYKAIATLASLAEISGKESHLQNDSFPRLIRKLVDVMRAYQTVKHSIPTASHWFSQRQEHKQWYLSDGVDVETATQTDSPLTPVDLPDTNWVEEALTKAILEAFSNDIEKQQYGYLFSKMQTLPQLLDELGDNWSIPFGIKFIEDLTTLINKALASSDDSVTNDRKQLLDYGIVDVLASLPLSLELGFVKSLDRLGIDRIRIEIIKENARKFSSPYKRQLPVAVIKTLEEAHKNSLFEAAVGSKGLTPSWYIAERVTHRLSWEAHTYWKQLMDFVEKWYPEASKTAADLKLPNSEASIESRALELAWKLNRHVYDVESYSAKLENEKLLDLKWPEWDWKKLKKQANGFRDKVIDDTARSIPALMRVARTPDLPDYFGAAVHRTGQECFDVLANNNPERFKQLFSLYFVGILETAERVRPQVLDWEPSSAITWYSEPIVDLMDISGYAYVFAELNENPRLWQICKEIWDVYLQGERAAGRLTHLAAITQHRQQLFQISPRDTLRSNRILGLIRLLRKLPRTPPQSFYDSPEIQHNSAFIKKHARGTEDMPHFPDPMDIFIVKYLMKQPGATNMTFGVRRGEISELEVDDE